jgi:carboxypeptidase family protein
LALEDLCRQTGNGNSLQESWWFPFYLCPLELLMIDNIRIASPCTADWEQMKGNDRIRHCEACNLNVYNLAAFTENEIRDLVANRKGRLCGRIYQRRDGTVLTENCPVGMRAVARRISRIAGAVFALLTVNFSTGLGLFAQSYTRSNVSSAAIDLEVIDPVGAPVPNAEVILNDPSRKQELHGKTDNHGRFVLAGVREGRYELTVSAPGLRSFPQTLELRSGEKLSLPVKLNIGLLGEIVEIDGPRISVDNPPINIAAFPLTGAGPRPVQR